MIDIVICSVCLMLAAFFFLITYKKNTLPSDELLLAYLSAVGISIMITALALWFDWWSYPSVSLTKYGTILLSDLFFYPIVGTIYAILLSPFRTKNLRLTLLTAGILWCIEYIAYDYSTIVAYHNWNLWLTYFSYFFPLTVIWLCISIYRQKAVSKQSLRQDL